MSSRGSHSTRGHSSATLVGSFALASILSISAPAQTTLNVPAQFATIQAAINAASSGDTIAIGAGVFSGAGNRDLTTAGKNLIIEGQGPGTTVVDCSGSIGSPHRGFVLISAHPSLLIRELEIANG